jgi:hypothetical protein
MKRHIIGAVALLATGIVMGQALKVSDAELAKVDQDLASADGAAKDAAIGSIKTWLKGGFVSDHTWRQWIPQMVKDNKQQDVADIAMEGLLHRPDPGAVVPLMQFRYQALLALKKDSDALVAAKSYFLVVEMKNSSRGTDAIGTALARAHPEDTEIVRKFRAEQTAASQGAGSPVAEEGIYRSIKVDPKPYEAQISTYRSKTVFRDRIAYGNLLLASDQGPEAEKVFKDIYRVADPGDQLNQTIEGIAKAIRAQDGNPTRAAAWFKTAQEQAATQTAPTTKPVAGATSGPATQPKATGLP